MNTYSIDKVNTPTNGDEVEIKKAVSEYFVATS